MDLHTERMFLVNICLVHGPSETQILMPDESEMDSHLQLETNVQM